MLTRQVPLAFSSKYPSLQKNAVLWNLLYATEHVFVVWYKITHQGFFSSPDVGYKSSAA